MDPGRNSSPPGMPASWVLSIVLNSVMSHRDEMRMDRRREDESNGVERGFTHRKRAS
jgi:hypothetical protein